MSAQPDRRTQSADTLDGPAANRQRLIQFHVRFGWWSLLIFLTLGLVLESMHGFKVAWYLNVSNEVRRLMWRLAHAHGTLLSILHLVFAATVSMTPAVDRTSRNLASRCLLAAGLLLPSGFLLGGIQVQGGDPSVGVLLVPVGGALLFVSVLLTALSLRAEVEAPDTLSGRVADEK